MVPQPPALHDKDRRAFLAALVERSLPAGAGDRRAAGPVPESEDPLEEGTAAHSSVLVWRVPGTEESVHNRRAAVHGVANSWTLLK